MSRAVLLAINAKYVHSSLAVWLLASGVSRYARQSHEIEIVEATINQNGGDIIQMVAEHRPDVVGISSYIWNAGKMPELMASLRERIPGAILVLGGPEASHNARYWLEKGADYVLSGEGERGLPALLDALEDNKNTVPTVIPGLCRDQGGALSCGAEAEDFIDPYSAEYFEALNGRIAYIETSRGCPFRCAFCLSGKSSLRFSPIGDAKERLYKLSQSGTRTIKFVDRTFNCDADRAYELFEYVIGLDTPCCFHFEVAADLFDERTLSLLGTAPPGRIQLEAGLQSFYGPALEAVNRKTDIEKVRENVLTLLRPGNIHLHLDLIAGLPMETLEDFRKSFENAYRLGAHTLQLGFLKLLHGSALREQSEGMGIVHAAAPPYEIISSPWLGGDDLNTLKQVENALQSTYNKGRFLSSIQYLLAVTGLGPFELYRGLGEAAYNRGEQLEVYARNAWGYFSALPGVDAGALRDHMVCDWLRSNRGKNMPSFLRIQDRRRKRAAELAQTLLGYKLQRNESMILTHGKERVVFVDGRLPDPVTGLYKLRFAELE